MMRRGRCETPLHATALTTMLTAVLAMLCVLPAGAAGARPSAAAEADSAVQVHITSAVVTFISAATSLSPPSAQDERESEDESDAAVADAALIDSVEWISDGDGRRIAIYPTDYGRYDAPASDWTLAWDEVVQLEPDVDQVYLRDQFRCHFEFARIVEPEKPSWNLEFWRDDVGYTATVGARCNP